MNEKIQEDKAILIKKIGDLAMRVPMSVRNGSVQLVRQWKKDRDKAEKIIRNTRSSSNDLRSCLATMEAYK